MKPTLWVSFLGFLLLGGCRDNLPKATKIVHMRILGSRTEVVGDETRATPHPGEEARVNVVTVFPDPSRTTADVRAMFIGCTAPSRFTGALPVCQEFLDAANTTSRADVRGALSIARKLPCREDNSFQELDGVSLECKRGDPIATLHVAANYKAQNKLLLGVVCERGTPYIDPNDPGLFGCDVKPEKGAPHAEAISINALIRVAHKPSDENRNPDPADLLVLVDPGPLEDVMPSRFSVNAGPPPANSTEAMKLEAERAPLWPEGDASIVAVPPDGGVADGGAPAKAAAVVRCNSSDARLLDVGPNHRIALFWPSAAREPIGNRREDLELSVFATAGELERRFTLFSGEDDGIDCDKKRPDLCYLRATVGWDPPSIKELPDAGVKDAGANRPAKHFYDGQLVRFFVAVRDERGGLAVVAREACAGGSKVVE